MHTDVGAKESPTDIADEHRCCVRRTAEKANIGGYGVSP